MGVIEDIFNALDRIPIWKRLQDVPAEVDKLKEQVAELETKLGSNWPGDVCRLCGARAARIGHTSLNKTVIIERWDCGECKQSDFRFKEP